MSGLFPRHPARVGEPGLAKVSTSAAEAAKRRFLRSGENHPRAESRLASR